jgi:KUP system potassium uptake protein
MRVLILMPGMLGATLFFCEGVLTPAISVLSAIEGLDIGTGLFNPYIILITVVLLAVLFSFQHQGTEVVGSLFGPVCLVWFLALAVAGIYDIVGNTMVLQATNPVRALHFVRILTLPINYPWTRGKMAFILLYTCHSNRLREVH